MKTVTPVLALILALLLAGCGVAANESPPPLEGAPPPPVTSVEDFAASLGMDPEAPPPPMSPARVLIAALYDLNGNNMIEKPEVIAAINDYLFGGNIAKADVIAIINLYLFGGLIDPNPSPTAGPPAQLSDIIARIRPAVVKVRSSGGTGSGVIFQVEDQNAYIVTNQHVVGYDLNVTVTVADTRELDGYVVGADAAKDLAVVRIPCGDCAAAEFGDSAALRVGDEVIAIGYARDFAQPLVLVRPTRVITSGAASVTSGIISAFRYDSHSDRELLQMDTPINPGNSGGPLLNLDGEIIGINTFRLHASQNLNYAVSETTVQNRIPALLSGDLPRPAPQPRTGRLVTVFGPLAGHMHHDDDSYYERFPAPVSRRDIGVGAWFQNPYEGNDLQSFSYGFRLRFSSATAPHLVFVVHSDGAWRVVKQTGRSTEVVAGGTAPDLRTGANQWNYVSALTVGDFGSFFLNDQWLELSAGVDIFPLGAGTEAGRIDMIDGYYETTEHAGAITHFERFNGLVLESSSVSSGKNLEDLMANVEAEYRAGQPPAAGSTHHMDP